MNQFCHRAKYQIELHKTVVLAKMIGSGSRETKKRQQWYRGSEIIQIVLAV